MVLQGRNSAMTKTLGGHTGLSIPLLGMLTAPEGSTQERATAQTLSKDPILFSESKCFSFERSHFNEEGYSLSDKLYTHS